jgi:hypothetical protein
LRGFYNVGVIRSAVIDSATVFYRSDIIGIKVAAAHILCAENIYQIFQYGRLEADQADFDFTEAF